MPDTLPGFRNYQHVTITVADRARTLAFYADHLAFGRLGTLTYHEKGLVIDFLDARGSILEVFSQARGRVRPSGWVNDDTQQGLRRIALTADLATWLPRWKRAGLPCPGGPFGVTLTDPDGNVLQVTPGPGAPRVAAVVLTVSDRGRALAFYRDRLGFTVSRHTAPVGAKGLETTDLTAGTATITLLSFASPTAPWPWDPDEAVVGLKHVGFEVADVFAGGQWLEQRGVPIIYQPSHVLGEVDTCFFADPDGNALELISGTCVYDS